MYAINYQKTDTDMHQMFYQITKYFLFHALNKITTCTKTGINENKANRATNDHITLSPLNCLLAVSFVLFNI
jgi:hypothetical protein